MFRLRRSAMLAAFTLSVLTTSVYAISGLVSDVDSYDLDHAKLTPLGLYMSSKGTYKAMSAAPDMLFLDVRDPLEIALSGHPSIIDAIVPVRVQSEIFNPDLKEFELVRNAEFVAQMDALIAERGVSRTDTIFVTCGSGKRSAEAVRILAKAGYTNVWHVPDGYEGDEKAGMNTQNAWYNAGLPWSYHLVAETPWVKAMK